MASRDSSTRLQSKELTRQGLVRAALKLLAQHSFDSLSLRQVTRQAGITPTAFYRHFDDMEELGLVLVEESFQSLGAMLQDARSQASFDGATIDRSLAVVVLSVEGCPMSVTGVPAACATPGKPYSVHGTLLRFLNLITT